MDYGGLALASRPHTPGKRLEVTSTQTRARGGAAETKRWITLAVGQHFGRCQQEDIGESTRKVRQYAGHPRIYHFEASGCVIPLAMCTKIQTARIGIAVQTHM